MYVGKELIDCTPYRVPHMYRVHRTTQEQEFNVQRLQIVLSVNFLKQQSLCYSDPRKEGTYSDSETRPPLLTCN